MSYLSRFEVNTARRGARALLASPQSLHAAVLAGFTAAEHDASTHRALWRVDRVGPNTYLYLMSAREPDLTHLVEQAGWPEKPGLGWETRDYAQLLGSITPGQHWNFRLVANPTRTVTDEKGRKKNYASVTAAHQLDWLMQRVDRLGIAVPESSAGAPDVVVSAALSRSFRHEPKAITVLCVAYEGRLTVIDANALRSALTNGIGRAKAYGCGLMTLARP